MILKSLTLQNFRSYTQKTFDFDPSANLIIGPNGSGKTNILEAIFLLTGSSSFRAKRIAHLINWNSDFSIITGKLDNLSLELQYKINPNSSQISRNFLVDGVNKTRKVFLGNLKAVIFHPEDIRLIAGSPSRRRDFIDSFLSSLDWQYRVNLYQYQKALKQRNQLLFLISQSKAKLEQLYYWNNALIKHAALIHKYRSDFFIFTNRFFVSHQNPDINQLQISYTPILLTADRLKHCQNQDIAKNQTSLGPHRDDYSVQNQSLNSHNDLSSWGSRGQHRIAVLAIKLAQIHHIEQKYSQKPLLLLDDIFSELDPDHQQAISKLCYTYQSFITTSQAGDRQLLPSAKIFNL